MSFWIGIGFIVLAILGLVYLAVKMPICKLCGSEKWACNCDDLD